MIDLFLLDFSTAPIQSVPTTEPHPTPSPINPKHVTKNNEIHNSMRFMQVYSRQRNLNPKQVQDSTSNPENEIAVPENLPQPTSEFENEVNTVLETFPEKAHDHHLPIAIRKGTKECTKHPLYPLAKFVSFKKFSPVHRSFLVNLNNIHIPNKLSEALSDEKWKNAMREEMQALEKNQTWEIVDLPSGKKSVGCKWVFTMKYKLDGSLERYKVIPVAKGYTQTYGVDYQETFAPTAKMNTVRVLLSLAANFGWYLE